MYQKTFAIDTRKLTQTQVMAYLSDMFQILGMGAGSKTTLQSSLSMHAIDAFRFVLGATDDWLTTDRQRFAEAAYAMTFKCSVAHAHECWLEGGHWMARNPRAHDVLTTARLDMTYIEQFGMSDSSWDEVFRMPGFMSRSKKQIDSESDRLRAYIGLSTFGFNDPAQFFVKR